MNSSILAAARRSSSHASFPSSASWHRLRRRRGHGLRALCRMEREWRHVWPDLLTLAGYWFGNIGWVKHNLTLALLAIIVVSLLPSVFVGLKNWMVARKAQAGQHRLDA